MRRWRGVKVNSMWGHQSRREVTLAQTGDKESSFPCLTAHAALPAGGGWGGGVKGWWSPVWAENAERGVTGALG